MFKELFSLFNPKNLPIINKTFWRGVLYTFFVIIVTVLVWVITAYFSLVSAGSSDFSLTTNLQSVEQKLLAEYPDNLEFAMSAEGVLTKNIAGPVGFWKNTENNTKSDTYAYAVVFDDKPATVENYKASNAFVFVGTDGVVMQDSNQRSLRTFLFQDILKEGEVNTSEVAGFAGATLNKQKIETLMSQSIPYVVNIIIISIVAILVLLPFILTITHLVWTVFLSLVVLLIMKLLKKEVDYNTSYLITLYAGVSAILLGSVLAVLLGLPLAQTSITLLFILIGYYSINKIN